MPIVKVLAVSGDQLLPDTRIDAGSTLAGLAAAAAGALGVRHCKLVRSNHEALSVATLVEESGLCDGDTLLAVAMKIPDSLLRIAELLAEYYYMLSQHREDWGDLRNIDPLWRREVAKSLLRFPDLFDPSWELGLQRAAAYEEQLLAAVGYELTLPEGLVEFLHVDAWLQAQHEFSHKGVDGESFCFVSLGELCVSLQEIFCSRSKPGCILADIAGYTEGYADTTTTLCIEWRNGKEPRFVGFAHYGQYDDGDDDEDDDGEDDGDDGDDEGDERGFLENLNYSFSDAVRTDDGTLDFMANEKEMRDETLSILPRREAIYQNFVEVLEALNSELKRQLDGDHNLEAFFLNTNFGGWTNWEVDAGGITALAAEAQSMMPADAVAAGKGKGKAKGEGRATFQERASHRGSVATSEVEMKVSTKKSAGFYIRAAGNFLKGREAREASEEKLALEAKAPVDVLKISALGEAINAAVAAATRAEAEGYGEITKIETTYPEMTSGRGCAHISIVVKRK